LTHCSLGLFFFFPSTISAFSGRSYVLFFPYPQIPSAVKSSPSPLPFFRKLGEAPPLNSRPLNFPCDLFSAQSWNLPPPLRTLPESQQTPRRNPTRFTPLQATHPYYTHSHSDHPDPTISLAFSCPYSKGSFFFILSGTRGSWAVIPVVISCICLHIGWLKGFFVSVSVKSERPNFPPLLQPCLDFPVDYCVVFGALLGGPFGSFSPPFPFLCCWLSHLKTALIPPRSFDS